MLEYQISQHKAESLAQAVDRSVRPNLISQLADQKRVLRGYGVTYNPHLEMCEECGEYPVRSDQVRWCSVCASAHDAAQKSLQKMVAYKSTSIERVYAKYLNEPNAGKLKVPLNFSFLFGTEKQSEGKRIAVWMSDTNNMGDKVPLWMAQTDGEIKSTFEKINDANIEIVSDALRHTFTSIPGDWLPFRIIVAGGDDLCIVMDEKYILDFCENISRALSNYLAKPQNKDHPVNEEWLSGKFAELSQKNDKLKPPGPFCFAGCFVVTSLHTPFYKIHEVGEDLLKNAKEKSGRSANSVTWRIMAEDQETVAEKLLKDIEKPVFISGEQSGTPISGHLSFKKYLELRESYVRALSKSHMHICRCMGNRQ
jgi:CRISPR/Cas system-associated protein Cas10 (large subunit of type III CRISPR-Cas system)